MTQEGNLGPARGQGEVEAVEVRPGTWEQTTFSSRSHCKTYWWTWVWVTFLLKVPSFQSFEFKPTCSFFPCSALLRKQISGNADFKDVAAFSPRGDKGSVRYSESHNSFQEQGNVGTCVHACWVAHMCAGANGFKVQKVFGLCSLLTSLLLCSEPLF